MEIYLPVCKCCPEIELKQKLVQAMQATNTLNQAVKFTQVMELKFIKKYTNGTKVSTELWGFGTRGLVTRYIPFPYTN